MESKWSDLLTAAHAWQLCPDELEAHAQRDAFLSWLSVDERAHYNAFADERLRRAYLAGSALCRYTLSQYARIDPSEWRFAKDAHGKPKIASPKAWRSLRFNLTHTDGLAIFLVSRVGAVGIDAEDVTRNVDVALLARHFLSGRQQARLSGLRARERSLAFFEQWVLHEAYVKGSGKGLTASGERIRIRIDESHQPLPIGNWQFALYRLNGRHVAAAAIRRPRGGPPIPIVWFKSALFQTRVAVEE